MSFQSMSIKLICEKQQEGESATHSLWPRLINPSLIWSTLVNIAITQQSCLQMACTRCWHYTTTMCEKNRPLPVCSWGTRAQCCSWKDSEVDGEPDLVPSEDVPRSRPRAGRAASPRPSSPRSGSRRASEASSCSGKSWSSWQTSSAGYALAHLKNYN